MKMDYTASRIEGFQDGAPNIFQF